MLDVYNTAIRTYLMMSLIGILMSLPSRVGTSTTHPVRPCEERQTVFDTVELLGWVVQWAPVVSVA